MASTSNKLAMTVHSERRHSFAMDRRKMSTSEAILKELGGFGVAEVAAEGTWLGVAALTTLVPEKAMAAASKAVGHALIEPILNPIESVMNKVCKLEECKIDMTKPREERAANLARALIIFTPALLLSWEVKLWIRDRINKKAHIKQGEAATVSKDATLMQKAAHYATFKHWSYDSKMIFFADEGLQLGAMYVLNNQLAPVSDDLIRTTTSLTQKVLGVPEKRAHEFATSAVIWAIPNAIGALGASAAIAGKHLYDWPKGWIGRALGRKPGDLMNLTGPSHHL